MEEILKDLIGRSIVTAAYHEIDYGDDRPMWNRESASFDSLDFGLTLRLDDDSVFHLVWGHEYTQYDISVARGSGDRGERSWDATSRWAAYIDAPIAEARIIWQHTESDEGSPEYPQSIVITFASRRSVVISAFESRGDNFKLPMMDHVTVFFDEAEAERFGLL